MKWKLWRTKEPPVSKDDVEFRERIRRKVDEANERMLGQLHELEASIIVQDPHWREKHQ